MIVDIGGETVLWNFSISLQVSRWCDTHCHETVTENESCLCCAADDSKIGRDELQISHNRLCYNTNYTCVTLVLESRVFFSLSGFSNFHFWFHGFMPTSCIEDDISITNSRLLYISLWQWLEGGGWPLSDSSLGLHQSLTCCVTVVNLIKLLVPVVLVAYMCCYYWPTALPVLLWPVSGSLT